MDESFVSVKAQTMRYILPINFFSFFYTCGKRNDLFEEELFNSCPKIHLENSLQQPFATLSKLLIFRYLYATSS